MQNPAIHIRSVAQIRGTEDVDWSKPCRDVATMLGKDSFPGCKGKIFTSTGSIPFPPPSRSTGRNSGPWALGVSGRTRKDQPTLGVISVIVDSRRAIWIGRCRCVYFAASGGLARVEPECLG